SKEQDSHSGCNCQIMHWLQQPKEMSYANLMIPFRCQTMKSYSFLVIACEYDGKSDVSDSIPDLLCSKANGCLVGESACTGTSGGGSCDTATASLWFGCSNCYFQSSLTVDLSMTIRNYKLTYFKIAVRL